MAQRKQKGDKSGLKANAPFRYLNHPGSCEVLSAGGCRTSAVWWTPRCHLRSPDAHWWSSSLCPATCRALAWPDLVLPLYTWMTEEPTAKLQMQETLWSGVSCHWNRWSESQRQHNKSATTVKEKWQMQQTCAGHQGHSWRGMWSRLRLLLGWRGRPRGRRFPWPEHHPPHAHTADYIP